MLNLQTVRLGDIASFKYGKTIRKKDILETGKYPVFSGYKIVGYLPSYMYEESQLIIVCRGAGGTGDIKLSPPKSSITNLAIVIMCDETKIDAGYLYWRLKLSDTYSLRTGSAQPQITINTLETFQVDIEPSIEKQKEIARQLFSLNSKIKLNTQTNQTLEQIAQAIFKSWFVDYDPVRAKMAVLEEGGTPEAAERAAMRAISAKDAAALKRMRRETPEAYTRLEQTAVLFPSAMVESELGEIPEGWEASEIGKEFDVTMGQSPPGDTYNEDGDGTPFFQGRRDFGWRYPSERVHCTAPKRMASKGDTLLSVRAPVGDINKAVTECCIGRGLAAIRHKSGCEAYTYYCMWELGRYFISFDSEGTVFGSINQKDLKAIKVVKADKKIMNNFSSIVGGIDKRIATNEFEIQTLVQLRDSLLPKLFSGDISVGSMEKTL